MLCLHDRAVECPGGNLEKSRPVKGLTAIAPPIDTDAHARPQAFGLLERIGIQSQATAGSFDANDVVEPMKPVGEPIRQVVLRNTVVEFGRGAQLARSL